MAIKSYKPTSPSRRNMTCTDYSGLSKVKPEKSLLEPLKKNSGVAIATAESPFAIEAAETAENIVSLTSSATRTASMQLS